MEPAALNPSEEFRGDMVYAVDKLCDQWLKRPIKEYRCAVASWLQRLIYGFPWLLDSLHPLIRDFLLNTLHLDPPIEATHHLVTRGS